MDCVSVRHRTVTGLYLVVYRFKLFEIEMIIREYSFYPQDWRGGRKNIFLGTPAILEGPPLSPQGEGGSGVLLSSFIYFCVKGAGLGIRSFAHRSFTHLLISLKSNERL